ncbi:MAG: hypothetical protein KF680_07215 [Cryobacterium sp.]|nr:hypothetical protein [Cryobacterium sp.]
MAKGIELGVGVDGRPFKEGIESGVIAPLDDATETLKEVGQNKSLEELEGDLKDAQRASRDLADETKKTGNEITQKSRKAFREMKEAAKSGYDESGEAAKEFKQEATQNMSQLASSFKGDMASIGDAVQGTLGGLAGSITGPAGIALGGLGAIAGVAFANITERSERMSEEVSNQFARMVENGGAALSELEKRKLVAETIDENFDLIMDVAERTGIEATKVAEALALGGEKAAGISAALKELAGEQFGGQRTNTWNLSSRFDELAEATDLAGEKYKLYEQLVSSGADKQGQRLAGLAEQINNLPEHKTLELDVDTSAVDRELQRRRTITVDVVDRAGRRLW